MKKLIIFSYVVAVAFVTFLVASVSASGAELLGLYTFEGSSPTAFNDVSGKGLDPTTIGTATLDASGYEGQAASFSGSTPITIPFDLTPSNHPNLTIGAWVRPTDLINRCVYGNDNGGWDRGLDLITGTWNVTGGGSFNSGIAGNTNDWQFVAVRYDGAAGANATLFVDANTYSTTLGTPDGNPVMAIGGLKGNSAVHAFSGLIDNFFIFTNALDSLEINHIRVNGLSGIQDVVAGLNPEPITINVVGDGTDYDETGMQGWRSTNVPKSFDVKRDRDTDIDNVYGTDGLFFIGDSDQFNGTNAVNNAANFTKVGAAWASFARGADANTYLTPAAAWGYADIDDPEATPGADVADWDIQSGRCAAPTGLADKWDEMLTFVIDDTAPAAFRVGIMAGNEDSGNYSSTGLRLVSDRGRSFETTVSVTNLSTAAQLTGMVFFDVYRDKRSVAIFSILAESPSASYSGGIAGVTFDEIYIPPKATGILIQ